MSYALFVGTISFLIAMVWAPLLIRWLRTQKLGKQIRDEGPSSHHVKAGTPTMGGLLVFLTVFLVTVPLNLIGRLSILLPLGMIVACGTLGAVDDLMSLVGDARRGMAARFKFSWLALFALVGALVLYFGLGLRAINVPFVGRFDLGIAYIFIAWFGIMGSAHAVNLTDGLDTLAGGTIALAFAAYGVIAYLQEQAYLVTFCFTVVGATLAFLWFNAHPAQVFMGDTGSLALGATLATVAFMTGQWLLLPLIGIVFVAEALSVIIQVAYFRLTGGKRLFKMTPLHHHFELIGWSETQVAMRFWLIAMMAAMGGIALALQVPIL